MGWKCFPVLKGAKGAYREPPPGDPVNPRLWEFTSFSGAPIRGLQP